MVGDRRGSRTSRSAKWERDDIIRTSESFNHDGHMGYIRMEPVVNKTEVPQSQKSGTKGENSISLRFESNSSKGSESDPIL